jgi:hypothetical protein
MSDTRSRIPKRKTKQSPLASEAFIPLSLPFLPEAKSQFSSEGFVPSKKESK